MNSPAENRTRGIAIGTPEMRICDRARPALTSTDKAAPGENSGLPVSSGAPEVIGKIGAQNAGNGKIENVRSEGEDAAILENKSLDREDGRHHNHARSRSHAARQKRPSEKMAAGPRRDREIHHLRREDKRPHHTEQRCAAMLVECVALCWPARPRSAN